MGSRMATRLLEAGFQVAVWNRTASACDPLLALGATPLSLDQIADYPVILTCLADDAAVQSVFEQIQPSGSWSDHCRFFQSLRTSNQNFS